MKYDLHYYGTKTIFKTSKTLMNVTIQIPITSSNCMCEIAIFLSATISTFKVDILAGHIKYIRYIRLYSALSVAYGYI